jgi:hypothetical protein
VIRKAALFWLHGMGIDPVSKGQMACSLVRVGERPSNIPPHKPSKGALKPNLHQKYISSLFPTAVFLLFCAFISSFLPPSELTSSPCFHSLQCAISPPSPLSATTWISTVTTRSIGTPFHRHPPLICSARGISPLRPAPMRSMKRHCSKHSPT